MITFHVLEAPQQLIMWLWQPSRLREKEEKVKDGRDEGENEKGGCETVILSIISYQFQNTNEL